MTKKNHERWFTKKEASIAIVAFLGLMAFFTFGLSAQEIIKIGEGKIVDKKPVVEDKHVDDLRSNVEIAGYTRPGNPDDRYSADGKLLEVSFVGASTQKFKVMGATVYFSVFRNTGTVEGDTFGTGMANIDRKFEMGRSFKDSMSPRFDRSAKYLYLYQIVNDRNLDARVTQVKGAQGGVIANPLFVPGAKVDAKAKVPETDDIASFALKLLADPRYITSWGHFRDSSFAANVPDTDAAGKTIKQVVDDGKGNKVDSEKIIRLGFSYLPPITSKLTYPNYSKRARSYTLGELEAGFGVERSTLNTQNSKAYGDLKNVAGQVGKDSIAWANFVSGIVKAAADTAKEPEFVQLMFMSPEERVSAGFVNPVVDAVDGVDYADDDLTRAIFRVDFERLKTLRQGERSVVFGFTTDLPPVTAPIRIDTPTGSAASEGLRLANYFAEDAMARVVGTGVGTGTGVVPTAGTAGAAAATALAMGTSLGQAATPAPAPAAVAAQGSGGVAGGFATGLGGMTGGGGGGAAIPGFQGGFSRAGGGGFGGGTGGGTGDAGSGTDQAQQGSTDNKSNTGTNVEINFDASLLNQQQQSQNQSQWQKQNQNQHQNQHQHQRGHGHGHGHGHKGHVVPAPASLLLGLLGLPGLLLLRRRKTNEATPEVNETIA